jgi:hypothetical protein
MSSYIDVWDNSPSLSPWPEEDEPKTSNDDLEKSSDISILKSSSYTIPGNVTNDTLDEEINKATISNLTVSGLKKKVSDETKEKNSKPSKVKPILKPETTTKSSKVKDTTHVKETRWAMPNITPKSLQKHVPTDEEKEEEVKQGLMSKIGKYYEYFPNQITPNKKININCKIPALQAELERCARILTAEGCLENVKKVDIALAALTQVGLMKFGIPAQGLREEAKNTQDLVMQELKEFSIKYEYWFSAGPEWRYMMKVLTRIQVVIEKNWGYVSALNTEVPEQTKQKYNNL